MKWVLILIIIFPIASIAQSNQNSILISKRHFNAATNAFIELRNLKKQQGLFQEQVHNKDIVIQWYERAYKKCNESDSIQSILIENKNTEIKIKDNQLSDYRFQLRNQKAKTIGLGIALPLGIGVSFVGGFYLAKELLK